MVGSTSERYQEPQGEEYVGADLVGNMQAQDGKGQNKALFKISHQQMKSAPCT